MYPNCIPKWAKRDEASSYYLPRIERRVIHWPMEVLNPTWNDDVYLVTKTVNEQVACTSYKKEQI